MSLHKLKHAVDIIAATKADDPKLWIPDDGDQRAYMAIGPDNADRIVKHLSERGFVIVRRPTNLPEG